MNGNVEMGTRLERRYEASHRRQAKGTPVVGELAIRDDMAVDLELLQGNSRISTRWEEKYIPVIVAHGDGNGGGEGAEEDDGCDLGKDGEKNPKMSDAGNRSHMKGT